MDLYEREILEDTWKNPSEPNDHIDLWDEPYLLSSDELDEYLIEDVNHNDRISYLQDTIEEVTDVWERLSEMLETNEVQDEESKITKWKNNIVNYIWSWVPKING